MDIDVQREADPAIVVYRKYDKLTLEFGTKGYIERFGPVTPESGLAYHMCMNCD